MITAGEEEERIVQAGAAAIRAVLFGDDPDAAERLLLTLDWYLDPYYKQTLPYQQEIFTMLEELVTVSRHDGILNAALQLLGDYQLGDFPVLRGHLDQIKESVKPDVLYLLNRPG